MIGVQQNLSSILATLAGILILTIAVLILLRYLRDVSPDDHFVKTE